MSCIPGVPAVRQKIPKDGPGPRGVPDCYYTSRVLSSTFRYVRFVKKLRRFEEEERRGNETKLLSQKNQLNNDFFISCDRRSLINDVARRVDLCMASYEADLQAKRNRLKEVFEREEEENIRKLVVQVQAGAEHMFQQKEARLAFLLAKRKKEHEDRYKDTPLSKCAHVLPCIYALRAKEAQEIQLYQMKEKEARKMAAREFDNMWHELAMKESEALKARMEQDAIEQARRDHDITNYTALQLEQKRQQREREKEMLKQEALRFKSMWEKDNAKEEEAEAQRKAVSLALAQERNESVIEQRKMKEEIQAEKKRVDDTWDALASAERAEQDAIIQLAKRKERDLDACNRELIKLKEAMIPSDKDDSVLVAEQKRQQEEVDQRHCAYVNKVKKATKDCQVALKQQIVDRAAAADARHQRQLQEEDYERQLKLQTDKLVALKQLTDAQARKLHQKNLLEQIDYNNLLKERALQEEKDQIRKAKEAAKEYDREIERMMNRPFYSDEQHPFMKQMAKGLAMRKKCPCSKPDYCK